MGVFASDSGCAGVDGLSFTVGSGEAFGAAGLTGDFESEDASAMIFSVAALLTAQAESQMRHCARVNLQPQVQESALKR